MTLIINNQELDKNKILSLLKQNRKLLAIKYVKEQTHIGLKNCKDIIDHLERNPTYFDGKNVQIDIVSKSKSLRKSNNDTLFLKGSSHKIQVAVLAILFLSLAIWAYFYFS